MMQTVSHVEINLNPVSMFNEGVTDPPEDTRDPSVRKKHVMNTNMMRMFSF